MKTKLLSTLLAGILCLPLVLNTAFAATGPAFSLTADQKQAKVGETVSLTLSGKGIKDLYAYEAKFTYDPNQLEVVTAKSKMEGFSVSPIKKDTEITIAHTKIGKVNGQDGDFDIGTISFKVKKEGDAKVTWTAMKTVDHNLTSSNVTVNSSASFKVAGKASAPTLTDIQNHWAKDQILEAVEKGIVDGYPDGTFKPDAPISRAEFAAILARALNLPDGDALQFNDLLKIPNWAQPQVAKAVKAGIITGYDDNTFRANSTISRTEIAAMAARGLKLTQGTGDKLNFADKDVIPAWAKGWVEAAVDKSIIKGREGNKFVPKAGATRAEATVIVLRMLDSK
ncbi:S-layer homology domain-containing protein [Paenibacillus terrigena]|uniref:S-layer homology domain-containing protein n=1 Tax=Paenibacillus terrigena TaxID=369333 RepID=UPI0028D67760|nr:S-layer homology domain-containing protein [Paenibacillus terrigena]